MTYRVLIFDWDGTLADSIGAIVACTAATVADLGLPPIREELVRETIGRGLGDSLERLCPAAPELQRRLLDRYRELWVERFSHQVSLFPGVPALLARLRARHLLAVATGKSRRGLARELAEAGLAGHFAATRTADEAPSKPHPQMVLDILSELAVTPRQALVIGDTTHDLEMAHDAGADALAVCGGSHDRAALAAAMPLGCLTSVLELEAWLAERAAAESALRSGR